MVGNGTRITLWAIAALAVAGMIIIGSGWNEGRVDRGVPVDEVPLGIVTGMPYQPYHESGRGLADLLTRRWASRHGARSVLAVVPRDFKDTASLMARKDPVDVRLVRDASPGQGRSSKGNVPCYVSPDKFEDLRSTHKQSFDDSTVKKCPKTKVRTQIALINNLLLKRMMLRKDGEGKTGEEKFAEESGILCFLWNEYTHIIAAPSLEVESLYELKRRNRRIVIYAGAEGSAGYRIAEQIIKIFKLESSIVFTDERIADYQTAAGYMARGEKIEMAIFHSGIPNQAAIPILTPQAANPIPGRDRPCTRRCRLLPLFPEHADQADAREIEAYRAQLKSLSGLFARVEANRGRPKTFPKIPSQTYLTDTDVETLKTPVVLVASRKLPASDAEDILRAMFDPSGGVVGLDEILKYHEAAREISFLDNEEWYREFQQNKKLSSYHPGAAAYWGQGRKTHKKIAAGMLGGKSYRLGVEMAEILSADADVPTIALPTGVAASSIDMLLGRSNGDGRSKASLAIVHSDAILESFEKSVRDAGGKSSPRPQLIAFLYPEMVHFVIRETLCDWAGCRETARRDRADSLRSWLAQAPLRRRSFGIPQDPGSNKRSREILEYYRALLRPGQALDDKRLEEENWKNCLIDLDPLQIQRYLISGDIDAALLTSGIPMETISQLIAPQDDRGRRIERSFSLHELRHEQCRVCKHPATRLNFWVLGLDTPKSDAAQAGRLPSGNQVLAANDRQARPELIPESIQGLVANHYALRPEIIPVHTYKAEQPALVYTVAVSVVLVCRDDPDDPTDDLDVAKITTALFDNEVRLRGIDRKVDLLGPLNAHEPSLPLHPDAREFYEDRGFVPRNPRHDSWFSPEYLRSQVPGILTGLLTSAVLTPIIIPRLTGFLLFLGAFLTGKRQFEYENMLRDIYFEVNDPGGDTEEFCQSKIKRIEEIRIKIRKDYMTPRKRWWRTLSSKHALELDETIRKYLEWLKAD